MQKSKKCYIYRPYKKRKHLFLFTGCSCLVWQKFQAIMSLIDKKTNIVFRSLDFKPQNNFYFLLVTKKYKLEI